MGRWKRSTTMNWPSYSVLRALDPIYVTAFPDRIVMGRHLSEISWETEVWCADAPSPLIHFDGERFLGPHEPTG